MELNLYTGALIYKGIEFSFTFDNEELRLIPPKDKRWEVEHWFMKEIATGTYTFGEPVYVEDDFLIGKCNENGETIVFLPKQTRVGRYNSVLIVEIEAYILQKFDREFIDRLSFSGEEIDCIYPTTQALEPQKWTENGEFSVKTKDFEGTTTQKQTFDVDGKSISVYFGISRTSNVKIGKPPLELHSVMFFEFDKTDDYSFVLRLWRIAKCFIQYLCYRKNVNLSKVDIASPYKDGKHETFATLYIVGENCDNEPEILKKHRYIQQSNINGKEGNILSDIASDKIYNRHLPQSYKSGRHIDAARFVMITAALEWTFNKNYPKGITKKPATTKAEEEATISLQGLIDASKGKLKNIYKFLKKLIGSDSLQTKIEQIGKDYSDIIDVFGNRLYSLNHETLKYSEMGKRLSEQRNNYAHGNLDKDFIGLSLLDLMYAEQVIYAMQLKEYGVETIEIQRAINSLFGCSLAI